MQDVEAGSADPGPKVYPPGLGRYESMIILRPDITEEERQALTERYEETLVGTGALDVELFNRGMQPLQYPIKKRSTAGLTTKYLDGWYLLFTFIAKPEAIKELQSQFKFDDDIIRAMTFRTKM
jgi:small subunit ribosomal protein S6